ncbi:MAG: phytanoyl-CoA dioxygenase family protein [Rhodospirillaceae bacterium]|nr:phytanoyl-CoA dioxygenase family protein [Rhodospirillaceae bacterium]
MGNSAPATLTSNGSPIPYTSQYFGALRETTPAALSDIRARYNDDGYVLLRGAVPAEKVWDIRSAYLDLFGPEMCKDGDTRRGEFAGRMPALPNHGLKGHPAHAFVRSEAFRAFTRLPVFKEIAEAIFGNEAEQIRRTPLRHFIPGRKGASRAHLDKTYIEGVPADLVTLWVPLGDCPVEAGALLYLDGSHKDAGLEADMRKYDAPTDRAHDTRPITHDLKWLSDKTGRRWLTTHFKAGDIVVHSPSIVHASTDTHVDMMRVSTDIRFQRKGAASDPRWHADWSADDGY